ncbi:hypothetical protein HDU76_009450 [Blyttiomyces sp. JEL0837]|nr:hypothetical protein HDU76_009450 [Blyttiomyces sp. JEL0837]
MIANNNSSIVDDSPWALEDLRIRNQHLTSLLSQSQSVIIKQTKEITTLKLALSNQSIPTKSHQTAPNAITTCDLCTQHRELLESQYEQLIASQAADINQLKLQIKEQESQKDEAIEQRNSVARILLKLKKDMSSTRACLRGNNGANVPLNNNGNHDPRSLTDQTTPNNDLGVGKHMATTSAKHQHEPNPNPDSKPILLRKYASSSVEFTVEEQHGSDSLQWLDVNVRAKGGGDKRDAIKVIKALEKERDSLEEELLMRYTDLRSSELKFQEELERRDLELQSLRKHSMKMFRSIVVAMLAFGAFASSSTDHPLRGVAKSKRDLYAPGPDNTFTCFDKSRTIPYSSLNDDFCDCQDGSDEPGTSACSNGRFHCTNAWHKPAYIPSNRVNDGICDPECCDGTDEWNGKVTCPNRCKEIAKMAKEESNKAKKSAEEGYRVKLDFLAEFQGKNAERVQKIAALEQDIKELEALVEQKKTEKEEAEAIEAEYRESQKPSAEVISALEGQLELLNYFLDNLVKNVETLRPFKETLTGDVAKAVEGSLLALDDVVQGRANLAASVNQTSVTEVQLEAATESLSASNAARTAYNDAYSNLSSKQNELRDLQAKDSLDYGPDNGMAVLDDKCLEFDTPEYVYELCFFSESRQRSKTGSSTSLGSWSGWTGKDLRAFSGKDLKYTEAKFTNGQTCWNGPARSMTVTLDCGAQNAVLSVSEPNKCEYVARVTTPGLCESLEADLGSSNTNSNASDTNKKPSHDEL